jgi:hypothetical protein
VLQVMLAVIPSSRSASNVDASRPALFPDIVRARSAPCIPKLGWFSRRMFFMSELRTAHVRALNTGGFLSFSALADGAILLILGYFAVHVIGRSAELLRSDSASMIRWAPVVLGGAILLALIPLVAGRLWSQLSTRYTSEGVSQWRFLSYRALAWRDIVRVYYDRQGLVLEGETRAIRISADFYRRPEQMVSVIQSHLPSGPEQPAQELVVNACRPGHAEFQPRRARAASA